MFLLVVCVLGTLCCLGCFGWLVWVCCLLLIRFAWCGFVCRVLSFVVFTIIGLIVFLSLWIWVFLFVLIIRFDSFGLLDLVGWYFIWVFVIYGWLGLLYCLRVWLIGWLSGVCFVFVGDWFDFWYWWVLGVCGLSWWVYNLFWCLMCLCGLNNWGFLLDCDFALVWVVIGYSVLLLIWCFDVSFWLLFWYVLIDFVTLVVWFDCFDYLVVVYWFVAWLV